MKKLIVIIAFITLSVFGLAHADKRPPTQYEHETFMPALQLWLGGNWQKVKEFEEGGIEQAITKVAFCCIENIADKNIYIVDIEFHAKFYNGNILAEEKDMYQRILFVFKDGRIVNWEPMPAYRLEEIAAYDNTRNIPYSG